MLRSTVSTLLLPGGCDPCTPTSSLPDSPSSPPSASWVPALSSVPQPVRGKALLVTLWPRCTVLLLPVCLRQSLSRAAPLLHWALPTCKWFVQVFSAALHRPPSSCCLTLHNVWLYLHHWFYRSKWECQGTVLQTSFICECTALLLFIEYLIFSFFFL